MDKNKNKKIFAIIGLLALALFISAMSQKVETGSWRYKMTVAVETPEGIKTGSAVRQVTMTFKKLDDRNIASTTNIEGEAVAVDLGKRGVLFALLEDQDYIFLTKAIGGAPPLTPEGLDHFQDAKDAKATLDPVTYPGYPRLVTFADLSDPKTVQMVMEWETNPTPPYPQTYSLKADHFEEIFGEGVKLKEITVERTEEPVTRGIEKFLTWLPDRKNIKGYLGGDPTPPYEDPTKTYLNGVEFSKGKFWSSL